MQASPPRLLEVSVDTTREAVDWVCALLAPADLSAELSIGAPDEPGWEIGVSAYLPATGQRALVARLDAALAPLRRLGLAGDLQVDEVAERPPSPPAAPVRVGARSVPATGRSSSRPARRSAAGCTRRPSAACA
jgi:hypothetical protein